MSNSTSLILYLLIICLSPMFYYYSIKNGKKLNLFILFTALVLFSGFRWYVGTDFDTYTSIFFEISNLPIGDLSSYYLENIATYIIYFSSVFGNGPSTMFLIFSIIVFGLLFILLRQFENTFIASYCMFIFMTVYLAPSFNITRNIISLLCFLNIAVHIINGIDDSKQYLKLVILFILGVGFHKSLYIALPIFFILGYFNSVKSSNKLFKFLIFAIILLIFFSFYSDVIIIKVFEILGYYSKYIFEEATVSYTFFLYIIPPIFPLVYLLYRKNQSIESIVQLVSLLYLSSIPLLLVGNKINSFDRLSIYSASLQLIFVPKLIQNSESKYIFIYYTIWYIIYFVIMFFILNGHQIFPYRFRF